jgi:hypothetical protein
VTTLLSKWTQGVASSGGLSLESSGGPVLFASALGAGGASPDLAPHLDIVVGLGSSSTPSNTAGTFDLSAVSRRSAQATSPEGATPIYGVASGAFCNDTCADIPTGTRLQYVPLHSIKSILAGFIRISVNVSCSDNTPGLDAPGFWSEGGANGTPSVADLITQAAHDGIIPIVDFSVPGVYWQGTQTWCAQMMDWQAQMDDFIDYGLPTHNGGVPYNPGVPFIYLEIGNEENLASQHPGGLGNYSTNFAIAAQTLSQDLPQWGYTHLRILTGGMAGPTAVPGTTCGADNNAIALQAINTAEGSPYSVSSGNLGVAVHPYGYATQWTVDWPNYYGIGNSYPGACSDLMGMLNYWIKEFGNLAVVFTEVNYYGGASATDPQSLQNYKNDEGAFLMDLFTWMRDFGYPQSSYSYDDPMQSPLRVMWFSAMDFPGQSLGLYQTQSLPERSDEKGGDKMADYSISTNGGPLLPGKVLGCFNPYNPNRDVPGFTAKSAVILQTIYKSMVDHDGCS